MQNFNTAASVWSQLLRALIRGEPEQAPNIRETGSGVYIYIYSIFIYLCVILHGNDLMRMLNHHVLERDR